MKTKMHASASGHLVTRFSFASHSHWMITGCQRYWCASNSIGDFTPKPKSMCHKGSEHVSWFANMEMKLQDRTYWEGALTVPTNQLLARLLMSGDLASSPRGKWAIIMIWVMPYEFLYAEHWQKSRYSCHVSQKLTKVTTGSCPFKVWEYRQRQYVPDKTPTYASPHKSFHKVGLESSSTMNGGICATCDKLTIPVVIRTCIKEFKSKARHNNHNTRSIENIVVSARHNCV